MDNNELNKNCPYCGKIDLKYNGYTKNGKRRYCCKDCGKTFTRFSKYRLYKQAKLALGVLYNLLNNDFYDTSSLQDALNKACKDGKEVDLNTFDFDVEYNSKKRRYNSLKYVCRNPKLLLCLNEDKIQVIKIHPATIGGFRKREILIEELLD